MLPIAIGDYVDFYSSIEHASNVGQDLPPRRRAAAAQLAPPARRLPRPRELGDRLGHATCGARRASCRRPSPAARPASARPSGSTSSSSSASSPAPATRSARASRRPTCASTSSASCSSTTGARATSSAGSTSRSARSWASRSPPRSRRGSSRWRRSSRTAWPRASRTRSRCHYLRTDEDWALDIELEVAHRARRRRGDRGRAHERPRPLLDRPAAARPRDRQRHQRPPRRPLRQRHDLGRRTPAAAAACSSSPGAGATRSSSPGGGTRTFLEDGDTVILRGAAGAVSLGEVRGRILPPV